ncbi:sushi, von Willebrand factor type A, EGF and pentraxin domain-containing protein 1-like isoform X2 [Halichondria panicea]|uniref:sushi, von Willebrand factor type A, EGF and pentraxin domain-containing protein 1-like isoform X2 n=1 Tax=Halichondria panicea TaxID=6063 RepID=UPI00312B6FEE
MALLSATVSILLLYVSITNGQNTGVRVVFDSVTPNSYTVIENAEELMVCIRVEGTINQQFSVTLNTFSAGSAIAGGVDYTDTTATHTFIPFSTLTRCTTITINDDNILEGTEFFFISVSSDDSSVEIPPLATVSITNDDTVVIGFNQTSYSTIEGIPGKMCVVIVSGSIARSVSFIVTQTGGTASGDDYIPGPLTGSITVADEPVCVNLPLNNDSIVEDTETVLLTVNSADSPTTATTTLNILDDDGVTVQLASTQLSVVEGNSGTSSLSLCVLLTNVQNNLDRDVTLLMNTQPSSADTSDFVSLVDQPLTIPMTTGLFENVCFQLAVNGDTVCEQSELYSVSVTPMNPLDMVTGLAEVDITILDDGDSIEDCGPLSVASGTVQYTATTRGSVSTYTCAPGFILEGVESRTCEATGSLCLGLWSGSPPTCRLANCGLLPSLSNGEVSFSATTFNSVASYTCDLGYILIGETSRMCQLDEQWSGDAPTCDVVQCPSISAPDNGGLIFTNGFIFSSLARYSCEGGYDISGASIRICRSTGLWSAIAPTCQPVDCMGLNNPANGMVALSGTTFTHTATYSCLSGFALIGQDTRQCLATRLWSGEEPTCVVECGDLPIPSNGAVSYSDTTLINSVATFTCSEGYIVTGDSTRTCLLTGMWSGIQPSCEPVDCPSLSDPLNGQVHLTTTTLSSIASYSCDQGFAPSSTEDRLCQTTGQWSGSPPVCTRVDCGPLADPQFGFVTLTPGTDFGSVAAYACNTGYEPSSTTDRTCLGSGVWSGDMPTCSLIDCGTPSSLNNGGQVTVSLTTFGSLSVYTCLSGYVLSAPSSIRSCMENGNWSGLDPTCDPVDCGPRASPINGQVEITPSTTFTSTATYSCTNGYDLVGITERVCEADGDWSLQGSPDPVCNPVDCGQLTSPSNGLVTVSVTTFLSEAMYSCSNGYILMGVVSRTCTADRNWSDAEPTCEPVVCPSLSNPANGVVDLSQGTSLNAVATYSCNVGYRLEGTGQRTCGPEGGWSDTQPVCEEVTCPDDRVDPINGAIQIMTGLNFGSLVTYLCDPTYALIGTSTQTCAANGLWTDEPPTCQMIGCPDRANPINGTSIRLTANVVQFSCDRGFTLSDSILAFSQCEPTTGLWSGPVPSCIIEDCGPPPAISDGTVDSTGTVYLSEAAYSCETGFRVQPLASSVRVCEVGGVWSGENGACQPVDCGSLSNPTNGMVSLDSTLRGSVAAYSCQDNYTLEGVALLVCMDNGEWSEEEPLCEDTDECTLGHDCDQVCTNTEGGYECSCAVGYRLSGFSRCEDIDECLSNKGGCAQLCVNNQGSRDCDCLQGFALDQDNVNCSDIDECFLSKDNCHSNASCTNTLGEFSCSCQQGFQGDGRTCIDIDECALGNDSCSQFATCSNTEGNYTCSCLDGFTGDGQDCQNIDECMEGGVSCAQNGVCTDNEGSYDCSCAQGFIGDGTINCTDIDECDSSLDNCHDFAICSNTIGSFSCSCDEGFAGNGISCNNINECEIGMHGCHTNAECMDTDGSFTCSCKEGFTGDGINCTDQCQAIFQVVLGGVVDCSTWRLDDTNPKLNDTAMQVATEIQQSCTDCSLGVTQITNGEFNCLTEDTPDQVTYRANLHGNTDSDCDDLIENIESWVQGAQASISVQGNRLRIVANCEIGVDTFTSPLECVSETTMSVTTLGLGASEGISIPLVAGAAAGGVVLMIVVLVVVIVVVSLLSASRRKRKSVEIPTHFVDNPTANDYTNFTPHPFGEVHNPVSPSSSNVHRPLIPQTSLSNFGQNNDLRKSSFNPQGDVVPMLGRSYSTLSRDRNKIKPVCAEPQEEQMQEDLYDSVYDDSNVTMTTNVADVGPEVEEMYDTSIGIKADEIYDSVAEDEPEDTFNDSFESSGDESIYDKADLGLDINF